MKISIIDLDLCNVNSISKCVEHTGFKYNIAKSPSDIEKSDKIIFPGIGSYPAIMNKLIENKWLQILDHKVIKERKKYLGICLGMQILSDNGEEFTTSNGLGYIGGKVVNMKNLNCNLQLPHTGWNSVDIKKENILFKSIKNKTNFYFNHSYVVTNTQDKFVLSETFHDINFPSSVNKKNIYGVQFHPEKSSTAGVQLIKNFLTLMN